METLLSLVIGIDIFFFERTTLDECVSIDIAEKYKIITLGGHNQEKEKYLLLSTGVVQSQTNVRLIPPDDRQIQHYYGMTQSLQDVMKILFLFW